MSVIDKEPGIGIGLKRPDRSGQAASAAKRKAASKRRYNATVKIFRRAHMYFGLLLVPFVLLYGATAILFNHPTWFNGSSTTVANPSELFAGIDGLQASTLAEEVRKELETALEEPVVLLEHPAPEFQGVFLFESRTDEERLRVRVHPVTLDGTTQTTPLTPSSDERTFPAKVETTVGDHVDLIKERIGEETALEKPGLRFAPDLQFHARVDDQDWILTYDLRNGAIDERRSDELKRAFDLRSFLLRLHVSRGYPTDPSVRTFWGAIVDVTAGLMIFWALSGVIMWWQMKALRRLGAIAIVGGVAMAGFLAYGMFVALYM